MLDNWNVMDAPRPPIRTVLEAYLPQIALIIFLALLPKLLLFLSKLEGIPSQSHIERAASGKYFYFTVLNVFIGVTVGGTVFATFKTTEKNPNSLLTVLAASLPVNATFFLTYVALRTFVAYDLELSQIVPLIIFHLKKKYLCKTEAEIKEAWYPGDLGYATRVPGTQGLCSILYQLTMFAYFGVKKFYYVSFLVLLIILTLIFAYVCNEMFYRFFRDPALEVALHKLKEMPHMERIFKTSLPACARRRSKMTSTRMLCLKFRGQACSLDFLV
ncbi:hypothetical protein NL676_012535 [Syzygium grande]|nr:hypothetical protein NL676_012535 [Syzygium grande]